MEQFRLVTWCWSLEGSRRHYVAINVRTAVWSLENLDKIVVYSQVLSEDQFIEARKKGITIETSADEPA